MPSKWNIPRHTDDETTKDEFKLRLGTLPVNRKKTMLESCIRDHHRAVTQPLQYSQPPEHMFPPRRRLEMAKQNMPH